MRKIALCALASISLLGCGSDDSRPGVMPGLPPGGIVKPTQPNQGGSNSTKPPTNSGTPPTDSTNPPPFPDNSTKLKQGIYSGTSTLVNGQRYELDGLVDEKNNAWFIFSENNEIAGFTMSQSDIRGNNGEFQVDGVEFEGLEVNEITIEGNYRTENQIEGRTYENETNATNYIVTYDNNKNNVRQTLDLIENKRFTGTSYLTGDGKNEGTSIRVTSGGSFSGQAQSCTLQGNLTPSGAKNYYKVTIKFNSANCTDFGVIYTGVAVVDNKTLTIVAANGSKEKGLFFDSVLN